MSLNMSPNMSLHTLDITQLAEKLASKQISSVELTQQFLTRIDAARELNAFIAVDAEVALATASKADERREAEGKTASASSLLLGIPLAHKDVFVTQDFGSTAGSKMLLGERGSYRSP